MQFQIKLTMTNERNPQPLRMLVESACGDIVEIALKSDNDFQEIKPLQVSYGHVLETARRFKADFNDFQIYIILDSTGIHINYSTDLVSEHCLLETVKNFRTVTRYIGYIEF